MKHLSAGIVVLCNSRILLVRQKDDIEGCHLSIPKGLIRKNEKPIDAAIRETYEETGLAIQKSCLGKPYLMNIESVNYSRRIIYYVVLLFKEPRLCFLDKEEILDCRFYDYQDAEQHLQLSQLSVLIHLNPMVLSRRYIEWLILRGYICKEEHYEARMSILNYTHLCKRDQYWDEVTMWCRGLMLDDNYYILFRPMKKFFERNQLYCYFVPHGNMHFELYEKKDGALGILYWLGNYPFIATRGSFTSKQAIIGTSLLYSKYSSEIPKMSKSYTYFFEIITPRDKHVVDYGEIEDLFLIGAYDNNNLCDVLSHRLADLNFPNVKHYQQHDHIKDLEKQDMPNEEGYVAYYEDGTRVKIKFKSYKNKHIELFNNIKF